MAFKSNIRVLGIDDSPFEFSGGSNCLIGCVYRGSRSLESVLSEEIEVDGQDATESIIDLFEKSDQGSHIKALMLDGITFAGFNTADIKEINSRIGKPVIAVNRDRPDFEAIGKAVDDREDAEEILEAVENAGEVFEHELEHGEVYFQCAGIDPSEAQEIISNSTGEAGIPEPLRVAHIIAKGVKDGKSTGGR